jgi:hypothetical protein
MDATIRKGVAIFSVLGCVAGLVAVAVVDWSVMGLHSEFVATNRAAAADVLSDVTRMMILLNLGIVLAVTINLVAVWFLLRGRKAP